MSKDLEEGQKKQLNIIIIGTATSYLLAIVPNLLLPYFGNYQLIWLGPLFTILMISSIAYAILKHHLFNIKLILVELAVLIFNSLLFFNVFTSGNRSLLVLNALISTFVFIFSILLLRGIYKDIRDREKIKALARDTAIANEKLYLLGQQKTEFVSIASHQLRTPLTVIKGYASMILEGTFGALSEPMRDAMEKLYKSSEKIVALVEDLLTVSRIEQGRMMLHFETVNLALVVRGVLAEVDDETTGSNLDLSFVAEEGKEFPVSMDEKKFRQVVRHILDNAIAYTGTHGRVRIMLTDDHVMGKIRLTVSDTGVGMTDEQIKAVFERFNFKKGRMERGEQGGGEDVESRKSKVESGIQESSTEEETPNQRTPGIGLYIAQEIIEAHHGTLHIESVGPNEGTTVIVELPMGK